MGKLFKKTARANNTPSEAPEHTGDSVHIAVLGEADAGKSALLRKFANPDVVVDALNPDNDNYWNYQAEPAAKTLSFDGLNVTIDEVMGSRGRMSNYGQTRAALAKADAVVQCNSAYSSYSTVTFESIVESAQYALTRMRHFTQNKNLPVFCFITMTDLNTNVVVPAGFEKDGIRFFGVSAVTGKGVNEAMTAVLKAATSSEYAQTLRAKAAPTATVAAETEALLGKVAKPHSVLGKLLKLLGVADKPSVTEQQPASVEKTAVEPLDLALPA